MKSWFLEKIAKIDKWLVRRNKTSVCKVRDVKEIL